MLRRREQKKVGTARRDKPLAVVVVGEASESEEDESDLVELPEVHSGGNSQRIETISATADLRSTSTDWPWTENKNNEGDDDRFMSYTDAPLATVIRQTSSPSGILLCKLGLD